MTIGADWIHWINENVQRGCDLPGMVASMVKAGLDPAQSRLLVMQAQKGLLSQEGPTLTDAPVVNKWRSGNVVKTADKDVNITLRLQNPYVLVLDNVLSTDECDTLVTLAQTKLKRSTVIDPASGQEINIAERSSSGTFFNVNETPFIAMLDKRIAEIMDMPVENGEGLQILHYRQGGEYRPHFDYFPPADPGSQAHLQRGGQRVSTMVIYLSAVEDGGGTQFPEVGLTVIPKKGSAVYFEYCNQAGEVDPLTLHAGLPVLAGEKWIATKWVRQSRYGA